jgi:hypothetical protein
LPHFDGPGFFVLPPPGDDGGQYWLFAELVLLAAEVGPPDFATTAVPLVISPIASAMLITLRDLMAAPRLSRGPRCESARVACEKARSFARSSSCAVASGRSARRRSAMGSSAIGVGDAFLRLIEALYEPGTRFLTA